MSRLFVSLLVVLSTISVAAVLLIVRDIDSITLHRQITELHESLQDACAAYGKWKTIVSDHVDSMERVCNRDETK